MDAIEAEIKDEMKNKIKKKKKEINNKSYLRTLYHLYCTRSLIVRSPRSHLHKNQWTSDPKNDDRARTVELL